MVCGTKAREGFASLVQALKGRWSSSHRWLCEAVVWTSTVPPPAWEFTESRGDATETDGDADGCAWQDTALSSFLAGSPAPRPLEQLPPMDCYPGLDYSTSVIDPGGAACARLADAAGARGVYTVGDPRSLIVVATLRGAVTGPVCSVHVAHWQDETPMAQVDAFFVRLREERGEHGRIELCVIEGCDGSFRTPAVIDHAWRLGLYPAYHSSVAPVFGIAVDPHGRIYRGDSPGLKAFLEDRYAGDVCLGPREKGLTFVRPFQVWCR